VATVTERTVQVNGIDLHLAEAGPGSGPPVVLLHGFPESWRMWRHQLPALAGIAAGLAQWRMSWYTLWFLLPGVAERVLGADDWAFYRRWAWNDAKRGQDLDLDGQLADLSRPGALVAGPWRYERIDGVDHWVPVHAPDQLNRLLLEFLGS
jgi:pimeloyl-ACP methyl ester carboxylesterase